MRGSPLLRALLLFAAIALFALPLWRLTHPEPVKGPTVPEAAATVDPIELRATFLPSPPVEFEVRHLGRTVWRTSGAERAASGPLALPVPPEGVDFQVVARWPSGQANAALRLELVRNGAPPLERMAWSRPDGSLDEVLTFQ